MISAGVTSAGPGKLRWNCMYVCVCVCVCMREYVCKHLYKEHACIFHGACTGACIYSAMEYPTLEGRAISQVKNCLLQYFC